MLDLTPQERLVQFTELTDKMIDEASKDTIADVARMFAIEIGHYERKYGAIPLDESVALLETETLNEDQAGWVADGLEHLAVALATVKDDEQPLVVQ